jgi:hypothetical protein
MTEPKMATWGDFLLWVVAERYGRCPGPVYGLKAAASCVNSEREAVAALLGLGVRPEFTRELVDEWQGIGR